MNKKGLIGVIILVIIIVAIVLITSNRNSSNPAPVQSQSQQTTYSVTSSDASDTSADMATTTHTVTYTDNGFAPMSLNVKAGDSVTFINQSSHRMWIASDPHPTHQGYSGTTGRQHCPDTAGTAFDQCSSGTSYTFVFQKVGTWGYHNHALDDDTGTIVVQ